MGCSIPALVFAIFIPCRTASEKFSSSMIGFVFGLIIALSIMIAPTIDYGKTVTSLYQNEQQTKDL